MTIHRRTIAVAVCAAGLLAAAAAAAQNTGLTSLRGETPMTEAPAAPEVEKQETGDRFDRAYRQQPPLIPHKIDRYQIDLKVNQCMRCHDWPYNVEAGAPKISETHYVDRTGIALDRVAGTRWFCTQCHVPQANTRALVENDFKSAIEVE